MPDNTLIKDGKLKKAVANIFSRKRKESGSLKESMGKYSAIDDDKGKTIKQFTQEQALKNHVRYLKNNYSDQSDTPSNVYRPENQPSSINYKKTGNTNI